MGRLLIAFSFIFLALHSAEVHAHPLGERSVALHIGEFSTGAVREDQIWRGNPDFVLVVELLLYSDAFKFPSTAPLLEYDLGTFPGGETLTFGEDLRLDRDLLERAHNQVLKDMSERFGRLNSTIGQNTRFTVKEDESYDETDFYLGFQLLERSSPAPDRFLASQIVSFEDLGAHWMVPMERKVLLLPRAQKTSVEAETESEFVQLAIDAKLVP